MAQAPLGWIIFKKDSSRAVISNQLWLRKNIREVYVTELKVFCFWGVNYFVDRPDECCDYANSQGYHQWDFVSGWGALNYHPNLNLIPETFSFHSDFLSAHISGWRFGALLVTFYLFNLVLLNRNWRQQKFILPSIFRIFPFSRPPHNVFSDWRRRGVGREAKLTSSPSTPSRLPSGQGTGIVA